MHKHSFVLAAVVIMTTAFGALAQTSTGFITGRITERTTGGPIPGAVVSVDPNFTATSDADGNFRLEVTSGVHEIKISAQGFAPITRSHIEITGGRDTPLNVQLEITIAETVDVRSDIFTVNNEQAVSNVTLNREDIRAMPGTGGDPLRAINSQPGVTAASGEFADLIVRGGTPDENLTFVDNVPVSDFTYFTDRYDGSRGGRAGILAPDIFDRAEFSAGGFGVRYGDRMSSALDIGIREASRERIQAVLFADSGTAGGSIDVPLGKGGSWLFSARRSFIDVALDVAGIADQGIIGYPHTLDFTNKFVYDISRRHKLSFTALNLFEDFDQSDDQATRVDRRTDRLRMRRTSNRHIFGVTLASTFGSSTLARTTAWGTIAHNDGTFFLPFTSLLQRSRDLRDSQFGAKEDLTSQLSRKLDISVGGGIYFDQANYHSFENAGVFFFSPLEEEFNAQVRQNRLRLETTTSGYGYAQVTWRATSKLSITPGLRLDHYGLTGETLLSPRIAARYGLRSNVALTFAAGIYRQPPALFTVSLTPANRDLKTQTATHAIGGIEWLAREDTRVRFEAYHKTYDRLAVQPLFPTQNFALTGNHFNSGSGEATGLDISVQKALTGFFSGQASYSFVHSRRRFFDGGTEFPSDYDRPHQLTLIGITRFYGFSVAAKYRIASGLPYTPRTAVVYPNSNFFLHRIENVADINRARLPEFASLDLRAEKRFGFRRWSVAPYIDIFNVTNHDSVVQPNYEFYSPNVQFLRENQRLPIFGFRLEF